ncbi:calmodulin-binding transcription activator CBT-like [Papaver somniferum]|uniref:calmodulin-binding transcription activator CBT-like n=1 Tax=Papaver somniferum TaxID=3469 RepID=UPI000E703CBB|nr:calmodulin-binding transcription activator CBT-like [Papaver somniferum]
MEPEVYGRVTTEGHDLGTEFFQGSNDSQEEFVFFVEKGFVKPSESVTVIGHFDEKYSHHAERVLCFVFGDVAVPGERLSGSAYKAVLLPNLPGPINFYVSFDGIIPISQLMELELSSKTVKSAVDLDLEQRLARMLVPREEDGDDLCAKLLQCDSLNTHSEIILRKYLKDWVFEGYRRGKPFDIHGLGVTHLCASLGYTWAIALYRRIYFGVDYRDLNGWTALHWAAFHGRQGATTLLLIHGANPSLLTKPNAEHPWERTAASIAFERGHNDLAAYLVDIMDNPKKIVRLSTVRPKLVGIQRSY